MTAQARYQHIVTLSEEDEKILIGLRAKGFKVIDIFRAGLKVKQAVAKVTS